jgi:hypothetical protein
MSAKAGAKQWTVGTKPMGRGLVGPAPERDAATGVWEFADAPEFRPNLSPAEVLRAGSFGGGYYRDIASAGTGASYKDAWKELPADWLAGVDVKRLVCSKTYKTGVNAYGVNCGVKVDKSDAFGLRAWEASGWMADQDPYGWFQWYCRFFQGRRSDDDERQLSRWSKCCGVRGRWKSNLIGKVLRGGKSYDDASVSPVVRQTLQHWGYRLTKDDFIQGSKRVKTHGAAYMPKTQQAAFLEPKKPAAKKPAAAKKTAKKRAAADSDSDSDGGAKVESDSDSDGEAEVVVPPKRARGPPRERS